MKHPFKICQRKHCTNLATCIPTVRVPVMGAISKSENSTLILTPSGSYLCDAHFDSFNVGELLNVKFQRTLKSHCKASGKARPDCRRAWKEKQLLDKPAL